MRVTVSPAVNICSDHILGSALPPPRLDEWTDPVGGFRRFQTVSDGFRSKFSDRPTQQREGIDFGPTRPTDPLFGRSDTQITHFLLRIAISRAHGSARGETSGVGVNNFLRGHPRTNLHSIRAKGRYKKAAQLYPTTERTNGPVPCPFPCPCSPPNAPICRRAANKAQCTAHGSYCTTVQLKLQESHVCKSLPCFRHALDDLLDVKPRETRPSSRGRCVSASAQGV